MKNRHQRQAQQLAKKQERQHAHAPSIKAIIKLGEIFPHRVVSLQIGLAFNPHAGMGSEEAASWSVVDVDTGKVIHSGLTRSQVEELRR